MWDISQDKPQRVLKSHSRHVTGLAYSPDGKLLASIGYHRDQQDRDIFTGELRLWNPETGQLIRDLDLVFQEIWGVSFSKDGKRLAFTTVAKNSQASVQVYDVATWKLERSIPFGPGMAFTLMFTNSPDQLLITGGGRVPSSTENDGIFTGTIWLADISSQEPPQLISPEKVANLSESERCSAFRSASMTPGGDLFVIGTANKRTHRNSSGRVMGWSLIGEIQMRKVDTGEVMWGQDGELGDPYGITVSPDGKLVGCCTGTKVLILNAESGARIHSIKVRK